MQEPAQHYTDAKTGISYTLSPDGYYLPDLTLPDEPEYDIGVWGQRRLNYLREHRKGLYAVLLTSGKLSKHLYETDLAAHERRELIVKQAMAAQGVTEQLKAENQMFWVGKVSNIYASADEIIRNELIYD